MKALRDVSLQSLFVEIEARHGKEAKYLRRFYQGIFGSYHAIALLEELFFIFPNRRRVDGMRRLNVEAEHMNVCIEKSVYALKPKEPHLQHGELLLLQKEVRPPRRMSYYRTNFALVFDHMAYDSAYGDDSTVIWHLWPNANPDWWWILYGSATIPTIPFSLNKLPLSKRYDESTPYPVIKTEDEGKIMPYILGALAETPILTHQRVHVSCIVQRFGKRKVLSAIHNHDRIVRLRAKSRGAVNKEKCEPNPYLAEILASYYEHCCQICGKGCSLSYYSDIDGDAFSETHYIQDLTQGGLDISENIVILCPDHHRIIQATNAHFNHQSLAFEYPNGRSEPLVLCDHFENEKRRAAVLDVEG